MGGRSLSGSDFQPAGMWPGPFPSLGLSFCKVVGRGLHHKGLWPGQGLLPALRVLPSRRLLLFLVLFPRVLRTPLVPLHWSRSLPAPTYCPVCHSGAAPADPHCCPGQWQAQGPSVSQTRSKSPRCTGINSGPRLLRRHLTSNQIPHSPGGLGPFFANAVPGSPLQGALVWTGGASTWHGRYPGPFILLCLGSVPPPSHTQSCPQVGELTPQQCQGRRWQS